MAKKKKAKFIKNVMFLIPFSQILYILFFTDFVSKCCSRLITDSVLFNNCVPDSEFTGHRAKFKTRIIK